METTPKITVREMLLEDFDFVLDYFFCASDEALRLMGIDKVLLGTPAEWLDTFLKDEESIDGEKQRSWVTWLCDGEPFGHSSISHIKPRESAHIHLHIWNSKRRQSGYGQIAFAKSAQFFMERFGLMALYCEPYAENPAPNKTLAKLGCPLIKTYEGTPTSICFPQTVNRYEVTKLCR